MTVEQYTRDKGLLEIMCLLEASLLIVPTLYPFRFNILIAVMKLIIPSTASLRLNHVRAVSTNMRWTGFIAYMRHQPSVSLRSVSKAAMCSWDRDHPTKLQTAPRVLSLWENTFRTRVKRTLNTSGPRVAE